MGLIYRPEFSLTADDKDITQAVSNNLISISLRDESGKSADRLAIAMTLPASSKTPPRGAVLKFALGFNGNLVHKGLFIVDELNLSGPPRQLQIVANSVPMNKTKIGSAMQSHRTRSFDDVRLGDLIAKIAKDNHLTPAVSKDLADKKIAHIDQVNESDMALLTRLALQYGAVFKPANERLIFTTDAAGLKVSGAPLPVTTIQPFQVSTWQCRVGSRKDVQRIVAIYHDVRTGHNKEVSIGTGDPVYRILYTYPNKDEAEAAANAQAKSHKSGKDNFDITLTGHPDFLQMVSEGYVQLQGFGDIEDEKPWRIKTLEWTLQGGGLAMHVTGDHGDPKKTSK